MKLASILAIACTSSSLLLSFSESSLLAAEPQEQQRLPLNQSKAVFSQNARGTAGKVGSNKRMGRGELLANLLNALDQLISIFDSPRQIVLQAIVNDDIQFIDSTSVSPDIRDFHGCRVQAIVVTPGGTQNQTSSSSSSVSYFTPEPNQVAMVFDGKTEEDIIKELGCLDGSVDLVVFVTSLGPTTKVNRVVTNGLIMANSRTYQTVGVFESSAFLSVHSSLVCLMALVAATTVAHLWVW